MSVRCRQKVCERLIRSKVVQLQSQLKQAAVTLIKEMDVKFTAKVNEIGAARQTLQNDVTTMRWMIERLRAGTDVDVDVDGVNSDAMLQSLSSSVASTCCVVVLR